jgi:hypothetical protein
VARARRDNDWFDDEDDAEDELMDELDEAAEAEEAEHDFMTGDDAVTRAFRGAASTSTSSFSAPPPARGSSAPFGASWAVVAAVGAVAAVGMVFLGRSVLRRRSKGAAEEVRSRTPLGADALKIMMCHMLTQCRLTSHQQLPAAQLMLGRLHPAA